MYHLILDKSNTPSDTSEAESTYPSEAHKWTFEETTEIVLCAQFYFSIFLHPSSIWVRTNYHLSGCYRKSRDRKWHDRKWRQSHDGSDVSHVPCPEVCYAHAQPEVVQYLPTWGLLSGSMFYACPAFYRTFFLVVVQNVGCGCSLRHLRPIARGNPLFYFHILSIYI